MERKKSYRKSEIRRNYSTDSAFESDFYERETTLERQGSHASRKDFQVEKIAFKTKS